MSRMPQIVGVLTAIGWLVLLVLFSIVWGLLRVAGEGSREEERAEAERARANRELEKLADYLDGVNDRGSK